MWEIINIMREHKIVEADDLVDLMAKHPEAVYAKQIS